MYILLNEVINQVIPNKRIKEPVYIAGPYAGNTDVNTTRATEVGKIATRDGLAAFVPHNCIHSHVYGLDEVKEDRENGILCTLSLVCYLASLQNSHLWVIQNEDDSFSSGTEQEIIIWKKIKDKLNLNYNIKIKKYKEWIQEKR